MADNVVLSSAVGTGDTIAADDVAGVKIPRSKIVIGADGTNDGDVSSANPLPVTHAALTELASAIDTEVQVDVVGALPAGTNAIGKLAANSGVDIGDVDVTSLPSDVAVAEDGALGKGVLLQGDDGTDRKNVAVDTDGNVQVDIVGSSLALESGGNLAGAATSLAVIDDWDESDRAKVNLVVGQAGVAAGAGAVGANTPRVTLASDDPGVALLGTIDTDTGNIATSVGVMDDWDESDACKVRLDPRTSGGLDTFKSTDIDETEEDVKTSAGLLYWIYCVNTNASARYLKVYNATAANVTVGTTATKLDLLIPPSNSGFFIQFPHGITFSTAISVAATTGVGDSDSGAPGANEVQVTIGYK